jgi:hypothetical protein
MRLSPTPTPRQLSQQQSQQLPQRSACLVQSFSRRNSSFSEFSNDFHELFDLLDNPISCGYLRTFCESEYSSENILFIIKVDAYKDLMKKDYMNWKLTWKEIDLNLKLNASTMSFESLSGSTSGPISEASMSTSPSSTNLSNWPSHKVQETDARLKVEEIFNEFISPNAASQICLPTDIYHRTLNRIHNLNHYGPTVFDEALLDPFRTLKRDILPRFKNSPLYEELLAFERYLISDIQITTLQLPQLPSASIATHHSFHQHAPVYYELIDFFTHAELFLKLSDYMKRLFCVENLWCYRMIELYESQATLVKNIRRNSVLNTPTSPRQTANGTGTGTGISTGTTEGSNVVTTQKTSHFLRQKLKELSWEIFRYFVAEHSLFEVSLSHEAKKAIMLQMAAPDRLLFEPIKQSVLHSIETIFQKYITTEEYKNLSLILKEEYAQQTAATSTPGGIGFTNCCCCWPLGITGILNLFHFLNQRVTKPKLVPMTMENDNGNENKEVKQIKRDEVHRPETI